MTPNTEQDPKTSGDTPTSPELIPRILKMDLPERQSAFLWGPRKTGKSTYLASRFPDSAVFDLLDTDLFFELSKRPALIRELVLALPEQRRRHPILIDEAQKVPGLLDEVHRLIEGKGLRFVLCGSSARKLVRGGVNLLGGRAWRFEMHALVTAELGEWELLDVLQRGLVPSHYLGPGHARSLLAYCQDYMREEVFAEGLTRNVPAFSRFFDAMAYSKHGVKTRGQVLPLDTWGSDPAPARSPAPADAQWHLEEEWWIWVYFGPGGRESGIICPGPSC